MHPRASLLLAILALSLAACGGGAPAVSVGASPFGATVEVRSVPMRDGRVSGAGDVDVFATLLVGDDELERMWRGFYSFDISGIAPGAVITGARLVVDRGASLGTPFFDLGPILVDHVDLGDALDAADYEAPALTWVVGGEPLLEDEDGTPVEIDVRAQVEADIAAGRSHTSFRLRTAWPLTDGHWDTDLTMFPGEENGGDTRLVLEIERR